MSEKKEIISRYLISIVICFFIVLGLGLLNKNLAFFGQNLHFSVDFPANEKLVSAIPAIEDVTEIGMNTDSAEFSVKKHTISTGKTNISLQIPETLQLNGRNSLEIATSFFPKHLDSLELAIVHPNGITYDLGPMYAEQLETLDWQSFSDDGITLWQRNPVYGSLQDFFKNPPKSDPNQPSIVSYHAALNPVLQSDFLASLPPKNNTESGFPYLEGQYTAYTLLLESGSLHIDLSVQELNYYEGTDPTEVNVFDQTGELLYVGTLEDDGIIAASRVRTPIRNINFTLEGLKPGMYRIELGNPDIQSKLLTNQQYLVLANSPLIVDSIYNTEVEPLRLYTNSDNITFPAWHIDVSAQKINLDGRELILAPDRQLGSKENHTFSSTDAQAPHTIVLEKNHLQMEIDPGTVVSFDDSAFFNPLSTPTRRLSANITKDSSVQFVLARYEKQTPKNGVYTVTRNFYFDKNFLDEDNTLTVRYIANTTSGTPQYRLQDIDIEMQRARN